MSERMKFEIVAILARIATFATPFLVTFAIWQETRIQSMAAVQTELMVWKQERPQHDAAQIERAKMEVTLLFSSQLLDIQKSLVEVKTRLDIFGRNQERSDERQSARDDRANATER